MMARSYMITGITEQMGVDPTGKLVKYTVVYYKTAYGDTGSVQLPKDQYSADAATALIDMDVAEHDKLHGMT